MQSLCSPLLVQSLENLQRYLSGYPRKYRGNDEEERKIITRDYQAINAYLQEYYGRWRPDAYTWNGWVGSLYGHLVLCRLYKLMARAIRTAPLAHDGPNESNPLLRRIYIDGKYGDSYGTVAYLDRLELARDLADDRITSEGSAQEGYRNFLASNLEKTLRINKAIENIRLSLPCEPRVDLPPLEIIDYWKDEIERAYPDN